MCIINRYIARPATQAPEPSTQRRGQGCRHRHHRHNHHNNHDATTTTPTTSRPSPDSPAYRLTDEEVLEAIYLCFYPQYDMSTHQPVQSRSTSDGSTSGGGSSPMSSTLAVVNEEEERYATDDDSSMAPSSPSSTLGDDDLALHRHRKMRRTPSWWKAIKPLPSPLAILKSMSAYFRKATTTMTTTTPITR